MNSSSSHPAQHENLTAWQPRRAKLVGGVELRNHFWPATAEEAWSHVPDFQRLIADRTLHLPHRSPLVGWAESATPTDSLVVRWDSQTRPTLRCLDHTHHTVSGVSPGLGEQPAHAPPPT